LADAETARYPRRSLTLELSRMGDVVSTRNREGFAE